MSKKLFLMAYFSSIFPLVFYYDIPYPIPELVTIVLWLFYFKKYLLLILVPFILITDYSYFVFNLVCGLSAVAIFSHKNVILFKNLNVNFVNRACLYVIFVACLIQKFGYGIIEWQSVFPAVQTDPGRSFGFQVEPSLLGGAIALIHSLILFSSYSIGERQSRRAILESTIICGIISLTSASMLTLIIYSLILLITYPRRSLLFFAFGICFIGFNFYLRLADFGFSEFNFIGISNSLNSWRNIPDFAIILNYQDYLLPQNPLYLREKLSRVISGLNGYDWLENTYSLFSALATTIGLILFFLLLLRFFILHVKKIFRYTKVSIAYPIYFLFIVSLFLVPKYQISIFVALLLMINLSRADLVSNRLPVSS